MIFMDPIISNRLVNLIDYADIFGIPAEDVAVYRDALAASGTKKCCYCVLSLHEHHHNCPWHEEDLKSL